MWYTKFRSYWSTIQDPPETSLTLTRNCDVPDCPERGDFKAPKSRDALKDYYWFCLDHVREYNQSWDFFKGMSQTEIEGALKKAVVGDRPTWRSTEAGKRREDAMRKSAYERFTSEDIFFDFGGGLGEDEGDKSARINVGSIPHPAIEALATMGLQPPVEWKDVKARYKTLAKRYHPDVNGTDKHAEEQLKRVNLAYSILKLSYQHFTALDE